MSLPSTPVFAMRFPVLGSSDETRQQCPALEARSHPAMFTSEPLGTPPAAFIKTRSYFNGRQPCEWSRGSTALKHEFVTRLSMSGNYALWQRVLLGVTAQPPVSNSRACMFADHSKCS